MVQLNLRETQRGMQAGEIAREIGRERHMGKVKREDWYKIEIYREYMRDKKKQIEGQIIRKM